MSTDEEDQDKFLPLGEIGNLLPTRPHRATGFRWWKRGVRGVKLRTWLIGGRRYTTRRAVADFIRAINEVPGVQASIDRTIDSAAASAAERELKRRGVLPSEEQK